MRQVVVLMCVSTVLSCALFVCDGRNSHISASPQKTAVFYVFPTTFGRPLYVNRTKWRTDYLGKMMATYILDASVKMEV